MIFILRPRSFASSVEWYTFLRHVLGWGWIRELQINVPDLSLALYLENPFQQLEAERSAAQGADVIDDAAILKTMQEENAVAGNIIRRCVEMLEANSEWKDVLQKWSATNKMGLAWRRYDRLEWVHGAHEQKMYGTVGMQRTHELELRPMGHYPTTVTPHSRRLVQAASNDGQTGRQQEPSNTTSNPLHHHHHHHDNPTLTEPSAVEGFLIRLTSQRGRASQFGRMFYKRLYFSTHDQYLCFSMPANAIPPPPPRLPMTEQSTVPTPQQIRENMPLIYAVVPFRLDDGEIAWLRSGDAATRKLHDQDAYDEAERRVNTLLRADGFVDLCKVVKVRPVVRGSVPADENVEEGDGADFNEDVADTTREDGNVSSFDDNRTFELVLTNGLIVRLEAYNAEAQREWIVRLGALVKYWKLRKTADLEILNSVRQTNLAQLNIAEQSESYVGQFAEKWELSQALASPEMFNMCGISCCRTVSVSFYAVMLSLIKPDPASRCPVSCTGSRVEGPHSASAASSYVTGSCYSSRPRCAAAWAPRSPTATSADSARLTCETATSTAVWSRRATYCIRTRPQPRRPTSRSSTAAIPADTCCRGCISRMASRPVASRMLAAVLNPGVAVVVVVVGLQDRPDRLARGCLPLTTTP